MANQYSSPTAHDALAGISQHTLHNTRGTTESWSARLGWIHHYADAGLRSGGHHGCTRLPLQFGGYGGVNQSLCLDHSRMLVCVTVVHWYLLPGVTDVPAVPGQIDPPFPAVLPKF